MLLSFFASLFAFVIVRADLLGIVSLLSCFPHLGYSLLLALAEVSSFPDSSHQHCQQEDEHDEQRETAVVGEVGCADAELRQVGRAGRLRLLLGQEGEVVAGRVSEGQYLFEEDEQLAAHPHQRQPAELQHHEGLQSGQSPQHCAQEAADPAQGGQGVADEGQHLGQTQGETGGEVQCPGQSDGEGGLDAGRVDRAGGEGGHEEDLDRVALLESAGEVALELECLSGGVVGEGGDRETGGVEQEDGLQFLGRADLEGMQRGKHLGLEDEAVGASFLAHLEE